MRELLILLLFGLQWTEGEVDCQTLFGRYSWEDIAHCRYLRANNSEIGGTQITVTGNVDIGKWTNFTDNLASIARLDLLIWNSTIKEIKLPTLKDMQDPWIEIENNPHLEEINIYRQDIGQNSLSGLVVTGNPKLKTIKICNSKGFLQFGAQYFDLIVVSRMIITDNAVLKTIDFRSGITLKYIEKLKVADNPKLERIFINLIQFGEGDEINISNNPKLKEIVAENLHILGSFKESLIIRANRRLHRTILEIFKGQNNTNRTVRIQDEGECIFKKKIYDLEELEDCKYVASDLWIVPEVIGNATGVRLTRVEGKIHLGSLRPEQLGFLKYARVDADDITSEACNFELETIPKYVNKNICPPDGAYDKSVRSPLTVGLLATGLGLLALGAAVFSIYWFWWRAIQARKRRRARRAVETRGRTNTTDSGTGIAGTPVKSTSGTGTSLDKSTVMPMMIAGRAETGRTSPGAKKKTKTADSPRTPKTSGNGAGPKKDAEFTHPQRSQ